MAQVKITSGSGDWTVPDKVYSYKVTLIGAGGGGGGSANVGSTTGRVQEGGGGGGGACTQLTLPVVPKQIIKYIVGAGGSGGKGTTEVNSGVNYYVGGTGGAGELTKFGNFYVNGGSGGTGGSIIGGGVTSLGSGGAGGSGGNSTGTIYAGGAGGKGGSDGSGYGAGSSVQNAGGGGGGLGDSTIYGYASSAGCIPYTDTPANASAEEGGKVGHYGTGGGGDAGFDSSGGRGVGGRGGDGLIILEYELATMYTVTVNATNCRMVYNGSEYTSVSFSVPSGSTISSDGNPGLTNYRMLIEYGTTTLETIDFYDSEGYTFHTVSPSYGTITADTTITASGRVQTYSAYIGMGSYYAKYKRYIRSEGATEYTSPSSFTYKMGDRIDVDWYGGGEYAHTIDAYHQQIRNYDGSNTLYMRIDYTDSSGSVIYSVKGSDAYNLRGYNCTILPEPYAASPTSTQDQYRCYLTYNANGGSLPSDISSYQGYTAYTNSSSISINLPSAPTRSNYTFKGWSIDEIKSTPDIPYNSTTTYLDYGKHTLYAVWEGNEQTITAKVTMVSDEVKYGDSLNPRIHYNLDGSDNFPWTEWINSDSESTISLRYGSKFYCENDELTKTCYTTSKWSKDGSTIVYTDGVIKTIVQTVTKNTTVIFTPTPYTLTLTLDKNDGSGTTKTVDGTHYIRSDIKIPKYETLGWGGHKDDDDAVFVGWSTTLNPIVAYEDGDTYSDQRSIGVVNATLRAVWGHIVQVEFYKDDISGVHIDTIPTNPRTGKLTRSPTDLSNIGELEFKGWTSTAWSGELKSADVASIKFDNTKSGTVYVYGKWSRLKYYPITFVTSKNVAYSIPDNTYTEWKNDITYKTKDESVIFNPFTNTSAKWQQYQSSYNITYDYDKELKFSKINNVFYEVSAPSYNDGDIHMAVSCGKVGTIDLGTIQDISDSYSAILTTIPVVPLGYSGTFCMDTGVQRSLSVSVVRVSPVNPIDNSEATDSTQWSNAKWIRTLKELMDRWQMMTDGVKLHMYVPADRVNNVPPIDNKYTGASSTKSVNAYITSMPITYTSDSVHKVSMTISFKIGTIYPEPPKLKTNEITVYKDDTSTGKIFSYPADSYSALPRCPSGIISESSELFIGWKLNGAGSIKYPGDPFKVSDVSKLYAQYVSYNGAGELVEGSGSKTISVPAGASLVTICAVGGGGAGGGISDVPISDYSWYCSGTYVVRSGGGGGGSGQLSVRRVKLAEDTTQLHIYIGKGGQTEGANGEATVVRIGSETGKVLVRAMYGYGGGANKSGGPGGEGYNNGGSGGKWLGYKYMQAMVGSGSTNYGAAGKNYEHDAASSAGRHYRCAGGGGGGAPPMIGDISKFTGDRYGGNGVTDEDENSHRDGTYGGGGGGSGVYRVSGYNLQSYFGKGGDGYVYLIWGSES